MTTRVLSIRPMQEVGRHSYSIYLWHWPIVVLLLERELRFSVFVVVACALTFVLSVASYRFVEQPVRKSVWLATGTARSLYVGAALVAAGLAASIIPSVLQGEFDTGEPSGAAEHTTGDPIVPTDFVPSDLEPSLLREASANDPNAGRTRNCSEPGICSYGDPDSDVTVVLFGDSHAGHWWPALDIVAGAKGWRVEQMTKGGCATYKTEDRCTTWHERRWADIEAMKPDMIILSNRYGANTGNAEAMRHVVERAPDDTQVVLFSGITGTEERTTQCLAENLRDVRSCEPTWPDSDTVAVNERLADVAAASNAEFVDVTSLLCNGDRCPAISGNVLVLSDGSHITVRFAESRADDVGQLLDDLALGF